MKMSININDLEVTTTIGVYEEERNIKQKLLISLSLRYSHIVLSDEIQSVICYDKLCQLVHDFAIEAKFFLLETFTSALYQYIQDMYNLSDYNCVLKLSVTKFPSINGLRNGIICELQV